jgi:crotonobetainyl-CoA:carnitine CoA-transferase CaiB-like acyl-CoA transferase
VELVAQPVTLSRTPARLTHVLPQKGSDTDMVLREAGCDDARIHHLRASNII